MLKRTLLHILGRRANGLIFADGFDGSTVGTDWVKVDTEGLISVSGSKLVFAGGEASPNWNDPMIYTARTWLGSPGWVWEAEVTWSDWGSTGSQIGMDTTPMASVVLPSFVQKASGELQLRHTVAPVAIVTVPYTLVLNTSYLLRMTWQNSGLLFYLSDDGGRTFDPVWQFPSSLTINLCAGYDNNDAAFTSEYMRLWQGWTPGPIASYDGGSPTPTLGDTVVLNGTMEAGDPPDSWSSTLGATLDGVADERTGGAGAQSLSVVTTATDYGHARQAVTVTVGQWYQLTYWGKQVTSGHYAFVRNAATWYSLYAANIAWTQYVGCLRALQTTGNIDLGVNSTATGVEVRFDDVSLQPLTLTTLLGTAQDVGTKQGIFDCKPTLTSKTQCGMAIWLDDETNPANGLFAYHDGTNAHLDQLSGGTWTSLIDAAATYSAGVILRVVSDGTIASLYYNGSQVGTVQTPTGSSYGTKVAGFSTYTSNAVGTITVYGSIGGSEPG